MKVLGFVLAFVAVAIPAGAQQTESKERMRTVSVRGEGFIATSPDQVRLSVQVSAQASTASAAMRSASGKTQEILSLLKNLGVDEKNIQTSRVNVSPTYDYSKQIQPPPIVGYNSSNDFSVLFKGKLIEKVGEFMDQAVNAGASGFGGLQYEASKQRELERDALKRAADDARTRADLLAKQLGASLGKVMSISENSVASVPRTDAMSSFSKIQVPVPAEAPVMSGELIIRAEVNVVFELK